ncbi:hypothetical protein INT80_11895 [Gallibacterium anatis]|uniref:Uncharacterized protein n=1 Tax=Gallibacterium anatis TaxID=750 RepID=A0A930Y5E3_9PAST|nr:hypothetical protein [Gallibacterium anatis]
MYHHIIVGGFILIPSTFKVIGLSAKVDSAANKIVRESYFLLLHHHRTSGLLLTIESNRLILRAISILDSINPTNKDYKITT